MSATDPNGHDEWLHDTRTIREWVNGGGVSSERLRSELAAALVAQSSTAQAVNAVALAIDDHERKAR